MVWFDMMRALEQRWQVHEQAKMKVKMGTRLRGGQRVRQVLVVVEVVVVVLVRGLSLVLKGVW